MDIISENKVRQIINELNNTEANSLKEAAIKNNHCEKYYNAQISKAKKYFAGTPLLDELLEVASNFNSLAKVTENVETDDRAVTNVERDEDGKIQYYTFEIYRKNTTPLIGKLSRTGMETIYRLYSIYGANLTQKIVSREFPIYTFVEFKRILRAFNIYKSDSEFPPHIIEEKTEEELIALHNSKKINNVLRSIEKDQLKETEKALKKVLLENQELKKQSGQFEFSITNEVLPYYSKEWIASNNSMSIYLSDMHIGATLESGALYDMPWDEKELNRRLSELLSKISQFGHLETLIINLMGDSIDGMDGQTARRDHIMPQNMDNTQQVEVFMNSMLKFIGSCHQLANNIKVYCVPCGNHGGDYEKIAHKALKFAVSAKYPDVEYVMFDKFYGYYEFGPHKFLICHGKDAKFMKKPLPLNLNDATSTMLRDYMDANGIYGDNIHVVKGDLHSNNLNACRKFDYRNVLSLFGSSDYCQYNYPSNTYGVSYELFIGDNMVRGTFENF